jgi:ribosomal protein L11 methyltransferase
MTSRGARVYPAIQLHWTVRPAEAYLDTLLARMDDGGLMAVTEFDDGWRVFFDSTPARDAALTLLRGEAPHITGLPLDVPDDGWAERSQALLGPVRAGQLVVAPPWSLDDPVVAAADRARVILIRPSMGFGTGHHASTRLCLSLLQSLPMAGARVLDVGTGSGVLAIAAHRLGAVAVDAIDSDPDALASAAGNLDLNDAVRAIRLVESDLAVFASAPDRLAYDVVVANLTGAMLTRLAPALRALVGTAGWLVASGIEADEAEAVAGSLASAGFRVDRRDEDAGWVGLRCRSRDATSPTASRAR